MRRHRLSRGERSTAGSWSAVCLPGITRRRRKLFDQPRYVTVKAPTDVAFRFYYIRAKWPNRTMLHVASPVLATPALGGTLGSPQRAPRQLIPGHLTGFEKPPRDTVTFVRVVGGPYSEKTMRKARSKGTVYTRHQSKI
jgi:hypothetical protein